MGLMKSFKESMDKQKELDAKKPPAQLRRENIITGVVLLAIIFGIGSCMFNAPSSSPAPTSSGSSVQEKQEKPAPTQQEIVDSAVKSALDGFGGSLTKFSGVKITDAGNGQIVLLVSLDSHDGWDKSTTISEFNSTAAYIYKEIYSSGLPVQNCKICFDAPLVNRQTGEESTDTIYSLSLNNEAASKIHWDNVDKIDITQSTEHPYIHPALKKLK